MNKKLVFFGGAVVVAALLIFAARRFDAGRAQSALDARAEECAKEIEGFERKYIDTLQGVAAAEDGFGPLTAAYEKASGNDEKRAAFASITAQATKVLSGKDPNTNTLVRRSMDTLAGQLNRIDVVNKRCAQ